MSEVQSEVYWDKALIKWITFIPPCKWELLCFYSKIACNLPNRYHSIPMKVSLPGIPSKGRSPQCRPAVPQECSHRALKEPFLYLSSVVPAVTTQQCHFAVAGQTDCWTCSCWANWGLAVSGQTWAQCKERSDPRLKHCLLVRIVSPPRAVLNSNTTFQNACLSLHSVVFSTHFISVLFSAISVVS